MAKATKISWAHSTFNPWIGCEKVSPACDNCYAEGVAKRMGKQLWGKTAERFFTKENYWKEPLSWDREASKSNKPWRVFCGSLCDVMEDRRDLDERRQMLFDLIEVTPHLTWLLLSKRPENFVRLTPKTWINAWPPNAWALTTAENQRRLDERLPSLLCVPAQVRGLSIEPMLGPITIPENALPCTRCHGRGWYLERFSDNHGTPCKDCIARAKALDGGITVTSRSTVKFQTISWVIVGGESGGPARPMNPKWAAALRNQCLKHSVPFHYKQSGEWMAREDAMNVEGKRTAWVAGEGEVREDLERIDRTKWTLMVRAGVKAAGRLLEGKQWDQTPHDGVQV